jgi:hypothetical protein
MTLTPYYAIPADAGGLPVTVAHLEAGKPKRIENRLLSTIEPVSGITDFQGQVVKE